MRKEEKKNFNKKSPKPHLEGIKIAGNGYSNEKWGGTKKLMKNLRLISQKCILTRVLRDGGRLV